MGSYPNVESVKSNGGRSVGFFLLGSCQSASPIAAMLDCYRPDAEWTGVKGRAHMLCVVEWGTKGRPIHLLSPSGGI